VTLPSRAYLSSVYVCYASLQDPLLWTQVVAYLEGLARRGHRVHLLSFEPPLDRIQKASLSEELGRRGIAWHALRYHRRPSLLATAADVIVGSVVAALIVRRHRLEVVHARNAVAGAMALVTCHLARTRLIFDLRGLMADEYADAGRWPRDGLAYRLTKWAQAKALSRAAAITVRTHRVKRHLELQATAERPVEVIPACANLKAIERHSGERETARQEIGSEARPVMVYVGKFTGWYMEQEMADFFAKARHVFPRLFFLIVTQADPEPMRFQLGRVGAEKSDYCVLSAEPQELGRYLAAADFAISFVRPCFSKISSSPTKVGEYLGAGLPVLSSAGIGDLDETLQSPQVGVLVGEFSDRAYELAAHDIHRLLCDPGIRARCRQVARQEFSLAEIGIPRYEQLYRAVAESRLA
jgi:glycosyltransferase involved in cell wall biosynthesis